MKRAALAVLAGCVLALVIAIALSLSGCASPAEGRVLVVRYDSTATLAESLLALRQAPYTAVVHVGYAKAVAPETLASAWPVVRYRVQRVPPPPAPWWASWWVRAAGGALALASLLALLEAGKVEKTEGVDPADPDWVIG